ncbi:hypothetical protein PS938_05550 [Pseudomonas fluorescens]|uniref:Uncharacterized protein n=1 Tax=Pseudomonas fluorescens TaxID=294 RepID=A0A5E7VN73_PSEFL|nr:hypothetical protein PS938_05550 [Pseudomonas fluorescens]
MDVNDNAGGLDARVVCTFFASMLAPTEDRCCQASNKKPRIGVMLFT